MSEQIKNNKKITTILILVAIAVIAAVGVWYFNYKSEDSTEQSSQTQQQEQSVSEATISNEGKTVQYSGVDNQTALSLLKQYTDVKTEDFAGVGEYVVSINGIDADSSTNFWGFYINGEQAQVGAGEYTTTNSENIEWRLEDVSAFEE